MREREREREATKPENHSSNPQQNTNKNECKKTLILSFNTNGIYSCEARVVQYSQINHCDISHQYKKKEKKTWLFQNAIKAFDKLQSFMFKKCQNISLEGKHLNIIKALYDNLHHT